jgi:DegV family protein with EDD domain
MKTIIITDSCCDLPLEYINENNIPVISLTFHFKGREYKDDFGKSIDYKTFYDEVRKGEMSNTSQINAYIFEEIFKKYISEGYSIIYIAFSSALSGTYNSSLIARENILDENKNADITIVDSRSASMGQGLIVYYANEMLKKGASKQEIVDWLENNKLRVNHWFTVDDLNHLKRGGRVSAASAAIGTILDIKPILHVNDDGKLIPVTKVKGRKKSIKTLAEELKNKIVNPEEQTIFISHGDSFEDAKMLEKIILEEVKVKNVLINYVGPVIGSHSGPGTIALFFIGQNRNV